MALESIDKRTEEERRLRELIRHVPGWLWMTDTSLCFTCVAGNPTFPPGAEVMGSVYDFVGSSDPTEPFLAHHLAALSGTPQDFHYQRGDDWYEVHIDVLGERGRVVGTAGTAFKVSEPTGGAAEPERAMALLRAAVEATADGLLVVDRTGQVTLMNQRLCALWSLPAVHGHPVDEWTILHSMLKLVEDRDAFRACILEIQDRPEAESLDQVHLKDGRVFERASRPQRVGSAVVGRVWSYRDISERERSLKRAVFLADATRLLSSLDTEHALEALVHRVVPDLGDGCAVDRLDRHGSLQRLVAVSRDPAQPVPAEPHPSALAGKALRYRQGLVSCIGVPLAGKAGMLGVVTLTAAVGRRYTQADLQLAEELGQRVALALDNACLYEKAQRALRSRDEFLSIAAHEVRGPINSLNLAVQVLLEDGEAENAQRQAALERIERGARRLSAFVDEFLELTRVRAGTLQFEFEELDFAEVVRSVAAALSLDLRKTGSSLSINATGEVRGEWDRSRIDQIVTNLLTNANKFGLGKPITVEIHAIDDKAVLTVRDQGIGIAPEDQSRIFGLFESGVSSRQYGGLGVGLYIVKTITEAMGGRVQVESEPGKGSAFTAVLPRRREVRF